MRTKILKIVLFFLVVSCQKNESNKLIGSWKMRDVIDNTEQNFSEKTTFYKDSLVIEMFADKKLINRFSAKYKLDTGTNIIHYELQNIKVDLKILKLTETEMELMDIKQQKPIRFVRAE